MTEQQTIAEFLAARLDEDEAAATEAGGDEWTSDVNVWMVVDSKGDPVAYDEGKPTEDQAEHIARHDPARVLREIAAKRRILADIVPAMNGADEQINSEWGVGPMDPADYESVALLQLLALPYSDHPDYNPEWSTT